MWSKTQLQKKNTKYFQKLFMVPAQGFICENFVFWSFDYRASIELSRHSSVKATCRKASSKVSTKNQYVETNILNAVQKSHLCFVLGLFEASKSSLIYGNEWKCEISCMILAIFGFTRNSKMLRKYSSRWNLVWSFKNIMKWFQYLLGLKESLI